MFKPLVKGKPSSYILRCSAVFVTNVSQELNTVQLLRICDVKIWFAKAGSMNRLNVSVCIEVKFVWISTISFIISWFEIWNPYCIFLVQLFILSDVFHQRRQSEVPLKKCLSCSAFYCFKYLMLWIFWRWNFSALKLIVSFPCSLFSPFFYVFKKYGFADLCKCLFNQILYFVFLCPVLQVFSLNQSEICPGLYKFA